MVGCAVSLFFARHSVILLQILPFIQKHTSSVASFRHCFLISFLRVLCMFGDILLQEPWSTTDCGRVIGHSNDLLICSVLPRMSELLAKNLIKNYLKTKLRKKISQLKHLIQKRYVTGRICFSGCGVQLSLANLWHGTGVAVAEAIGYGVHGPCIDRCLEKSEGVQSVKSFSPRDCTNTKHFAHANTLNFQISLGWGAVFGLSMALGGRRSSRPLKSKTLLSAFGL